MTEADRCCFRNCRSQTQTADLRIAIWPPSDLPVINAFYHVSCFQAARDSAIEADPEEQHGRIPPGARCVFCGELLPIMGKHPFALEVCENDGMSRYWAHADCIKAIIHMDLNI